MLVEFIEFENSRKQVLAAALLLLTACSAPPPLRPIPQVRYAQPVPSSQLYNRRTLVDVRQVVPGVVCDLRYASSRNLIRKNVYPPGMPCLLQATTGEKLRRAQQILRGQGFGLKIWDAWRPGEVQVALHESSRTSHLFVDPAEAWSKHCAGMAVDVTLVDAQGREQRMPTDFDNAGAAADAFYRGTNPEVRRNLAMLQSAMLASGFRSIEREWWHFDDVDFNESYPPPPIFAHDVGIALPAIQVQ